MLRSPGIDQAPSILYTRPPRHIIVRRENCVGDREFQELSGGPASPEVVREISPYDSVGLDLQPAIRHRLPGIRPRVVSPRV